MNPTKAINFTPQNHRKSIDGLKDQTRRVVQNRYIDFIGAGGKDSPEWSDPRWWGFENEYGEWFTLESNGDSELIPRPYKVGDIVALRTSWAVSEAFDHVKPSDLPTALTRAGLWFASDGDKPAWAGKTRPAMFLPKYFWHLCPLARIESVRVERLQEISEADAIAEGIDREWCDDQGESPGRYLYFKTGVTRTGFGHSKASDAFLESWESIHGKGAWSANPWVWVYKYKMLSKATGN